MDIQWHSPTDPTVIKHPMQSDVLAVAVAMVETAESLRTAAARVMGSWRPGVIADESHLLCDSPRQQGLVSMSQ